MSSPASVSRTKRSTAAESSTSSSSRSWRVPSATRSRFVAWLSVASAGTGPALFSWPSDGPTVTRSSRTRDAPLSWTPPVSKSRMTTSVTVTSSLSLPWMPMWELRPSVPLLTCTRLAGTSGASSAPNWGGPELALKGLSASSMIEKKRWRSRNSRDDRISWPLRSTTTSSAATEMAAKKPSQKPRSGG